MSDRSTNRPFLRHWIIGSLFFYTVVEATLETRCTESTSELLAVIIAKTVWVIAMVGAVKGSNGAKRVLFVLSAISAAAVLFSFSRVAQASPYVALFLLVGVAIKTSVFLSIAASTVSRNRKIAIMSLPSRLRKPG